MKDLNIYEFKNIIYKGNILFDFFTFCLKKKPWLFYYIFIIIGSFVLNILTIISDLKFKENVLNIFKHFKNKDDLLKQFYDKKKKKLTNIIKTKNNLIISSQPDFLVKTMLKNCDFKIQASITNINNLKIKNERFSLIDFVNSLNSKKEFNVIYYSNNKVSKEIENCVNSSFVFDRGNFVSNEDYKESFIKKIFNLYFTKSFILFVFCGGVGTLVNFFASWLVSGFLDAVAAYVCGYALSLIVTYLLTTLLLFKKKISFTKFVKFVVSYIPNFIILFTFVAIFIKILLWNKLIVYLLAGLLGIPITFLILKIYAFFDKKNIKKGEQNNV